MGLGVLASLVLAAAVAFPGTLAAAAADPQTIRHLLNTTTLTGAPVTGGTPFDQLAVTLTPNKARDNDDQVLINQTDVPWKVATGSIKHTVTGGLDLAMERLDRQNYAFDGTPATAKIDAPSIVTAYLNPSINAQLDYSKTPQNRNVSTADTIAVYLQDQLEFTREWKAVLGVRYDYYDSQTNQTANGPAGTNSGPYSERPPSTPPSGWMPAGSALVASGICE